MPQHKLVLYIAGRTALSDKAIANLAAIETQLPDAFQLSVVDVLEQPELADVNGILATPTLCIKSPAPERHIIGDLSDHGRVLAGLDCRRVSQAK